MTAEEFQKSIVTISKTALATLPVASYCGPIVIVDTMEKLYKVVDDIRKSKIIGFDTETRPSFRKGQMFNMSLIQLCTPHCCYLFRTNKIGYPKELMDILEDPDLLKIGLSIHDDFHNMQKVAEIEPRGFVDLQSFVKDYKIADNSLSRIYGILFGERISKGQRLTNWEAEELTDSQQHYAALDAYSCIRIYNYLSEGNFDPKKSQYLTLPPEPTEDNKEEGK